MRVFRQFFLFLLGVAACASYGQSVHATVASIYVNEVEVIRLRASAAGRSPSERAAYLAPLLEKALSRGAVEAQRVGKHAARLVVGGKPWVLVSQDEARAAQTSALALARAWANNIRAAVALPAVKLEVRNLNAPVGGTRNVTITGRAARTCTLQVSDDKVLTVSRTGAVLTIRGVTKGDARITVSAGSTATTVDVSVLPIAAYFPQTIEAFVTGTPASRDTVAGALTASLTTELKVVDGAQVGFTPPMTSEIPTGESRTYLVHVRVSGPQAYTSDGFVNVTVRNSAIGYRSEAELWYSNNPEPVKKAMRLFVGGLKAGEPVRMLYHHINKSRGSLTMSVEAINNTNEPARVLIIPGDADPAQNPVAAGFQAADRFVRAWTKYSGEIVDIPPYSILPISLRHMRKNDTVSGLCYLRLLDGGPEQIIVRAEARLPHAVEHKWKVAMASPTPWRIAGFKKIGDLASVPLPDSVHIYPNPFKTEEVAYSVGGPYGFVRIGQTPIARQDNQGALDGNFGVTYTITADIANPTNKIADVEVVYEASAGYGGALFMIDGDLRRTPVLQPKEETRLSRFKLDPGESKTLRIMTVPLSGSAYPCTLTIRPVQPTERTNGGQKP